MTYSIHPDSQLVDLFSKKPYQGANPADAKVLVLGNDANYSSEITNHDFFKRIIEYHRDGVKFWKMVGVHHPFLLDDYPGEIGTAGVRYHKKFAKMGFNAECADKFSFIELLDKPTIGNTGDNRELFFQLLNPKHLHHIEELIFNSGPKFVIVNQTLIRLIGKISRELGCLTKLSRLISGAAPRSMVESNEYPGLVIYSGYSFSHTITNKYLEDLANKIMDHLSVS